LNYDDVGKFIDNSRVEVDPDQGLPTEDQILEVIVEEAGVDHDLGQDPLKKVLIQSN